VSNSKRLRQAPRDVYRLAAADGTDRLKWLSDALDKPQVREDPVFQTMVGAMALCADDDGYFDEDTLMDTMEVLGLRVHDRPRARTWLVGP
jgi:hypothetical protein